MHTPDNGKADVIFDIMRSYAKALNRIGKPEAIRIHAARKTFEEAWQDGETVETRKARYDFKPVSSSERCRQQGNLFQVRLIRSYRALLCLRRGWHIRMVARCLRQERIQTEPPDSNSLRTRTPARGETS